ncbi:alpha/beta fold hydrolase [Mycolicibacterium poriferae]
MFRNLINSLADSYHLIAPDHIGYGQSSMPTIHEFDYSFDNLTAVTEKLISHLGLDRFAIYIHDYGAPIGLRIASANPERITAIITQSGNPTWRDSPRSGTSCSPTRKTAPPTSAASANTSPIQRPTGSTPTACPPTGSNSSHPKRGSWTRQAWIAKATTRSNCRCSGTTSSTSTATRSSRSTSAPTNHPCW